MPRHKKDDPHECSRPRRAARLFAAGHVGVVTVAALAYEIAGRPEAGGPVVALTAFPGETLLLVALIRPLALLLGADPGTEETGFSLLTPLLHGAGALVNVLIAWGVVTFARHFEAERARSRSR